MCVWVSGGGIKELRADLPSGDFHGFVEKFKGACLTLLEENSFGV